MNPRGKYLTTNNRGDPVVYEENDIVIYNGITYIAKRRNTFIEGLPDSERSPWSVLSSRVNHTSGENKPPNPNEGDEWYDTANGVLFKYLNDGDSKQWVEI